MLGVGENTACRCFLIVVQVLLAMVDGVCLVCVLILRKGSLVCIAPLWDGHDHLIFNENSEVNVLCNVLLYGTGAIAGWSLISLLIHCCWGNRFWFGVQLTISIVATSFTVLGVAVLTTNFFLWCDDMMKKIQEAHSCYDAADLYTNRTSDSDPSMTKYYKTNLIQQGCSWAGALLLLLTTVAYACVMLSQRHEPERRILYVQGDDDNQPLLQRHEDCEGEGNGRVHVIRADMHNVL